VDSNQNAYCKSQEGKITRLYLTARWRRSFRVLHNWTAPRFVQII